MPLPGVSTMTGSTAAASCNRTSGPKDQETRRARDEQNPR